MRKSYRINKGLLPSIDNRSLEVESRTKAGYWENDLIVSKQSKSKLKTIDKRLSGIVLIKKVKVKNGIIAESNKAMIIRLSKMPNQYLKTLTMDRGSENLGYLEIEKP